MADETELDTGAGPAPEMQPDTPGAKLRAAREAAGLSLAEVATRTRIALRQLEAVERDDYAALPGIPYAVGFARAYARAVDLDEVAIAAEVREAVHSSDMATNRYEVFEPVDPARVPSRTLAWTAAIIVILLAADGRGNGAGRGEGQGSGRRQHRTGRASCAASRLYRNRRCLAAHL